MDRLTKADILNLLAKEGWEFVDIDEDNGWYNVVNSFNSPYIDEEFEGAIAIYSYEQKLNDVHKAVVFCRQAEFPRMDRVDVLVYAVGKTPVKAFIRNRKGFLASGQFVHLEFDDYWVNLQ